MCGMFVKGGSMKTIITFSGTKVLLFLQICNRKGDFNNKLT